MCGRYRLTRFQLRELGLRVQPQEFEEIGHHPRQFPKFNIAPSHFVRVVRWSDDNRPESAMVRWGFIPSWSKENPKFQPINARAETVATSGMFRQAFKQQRCLVPADGFYEWKKIGAAKQPMFIHRRDDELFCFAGLWDRWKPPEAEPVDTMAIITKTPNGLMEPIHNRMPVILRKVDYEKWLNPQTPTQAVMGLLEAYPDDDFEAYPVSTHVNSPKNDDSECSQPT